MLKRIKDWLGLNTLTGVEVRLGKHGVEHVNACTLKLSGDLLSVVDKKESLKSLTHFDKHFKKGNMALCLTGRGILTKEISSATVPDQQVVQQLMPNAKVEEFYCQFQKEEEFLRVSIIRKATADTILSELHDMGYRVVALRLEENEPDAAYSTAFGVLLKQDINEVTDTQFSGNRQQMFAKAKVNGMALMAAVALLILLMVNFFLSGYFSHKADQLTAMANASGMKITKFRMMEGDVAEKTRLITSLGWTGGYSLSWLTGRLVSTKPNTITLRYLSVNPILQSKSPGSSSQEIYQVRKVVIEGYCDQAATLNNWLFKIRSENFISECSVGHYELNKQTGLATFALHISLKDYES